MPAFRIEKAAEMPQWIPTVMSIIFVFLWTFTMLPHTLIIQNFSLIAGALIGVYVLALNWRLLFSKQAIPIWVVLLLFFWIGIHLFYIGQNFDLQLREFQSLWKRAALGSIFGLGFGISVVQANKNKHWKIVLFGLFMPTFIYYIKYVATFMLPSFGINLPDFLRLYLGPAAFYVPKISYVFYCLPALAFALGMLLMQVRKGFYIGSIKANLFWVIAIILVLGVFYLENIKNGIMYVFLLTILFVISIIKSGVRKLPSLSLAVVVFIPLLVCALVLNNLKTNESWLNLLEDLKVAHISSPENIWKTAESHYPLNGNGIPVASTNFDRAFYLKVGLELIGKNPLGYGLVHGSFGLMARDYWPNAPLIQSHSGWLDLMLGIGIPGTFLLLASAVLAIQKVQSVAEPWSTFGTWILGSILLLYLSTEVSQKNYVDTFVWLIILVASLGLQKFPRSISKDF